MIKSDHELELMSLANKVTLTAYHAAYQAVREGMTRPEFEALITAANERLGFPGEVDIDIGENSSFPHGSIVPQVIRDGTLVLIDGGGPVQGYQSDISRTFVFGKPSDKMKKIFDIVHRAQAAALKAARPGVECQALSMQPRALK
jgi:Xaa-Pro dipeptidase